MQPAVTVVVPARNATGCLPTLLDALRTQTADPDSYEVIVVDDASSDHTPQLVRDSGFARLLEMPAQRGSYAARVLAIEESRSELFAFTDADCVPADDWIATGLNAMSTQRAELIAGQIDVPLGARPTAAALLGLAAHHLDQEYHVNEQGFGATANLWVRRRAFDLAGSFDANLTSSGDAEFCRRATTAGAQVVYDESIVVSHPPRSRARDLVRKQLRIGYGAAQVRVREPSQGIPRIWARPGAYVPRFKVRGLEIIERRGYQLSPRRRVQVAAAQYFYSQLPVALGNLGGAFHEARVRRMRRAGAPAATAEP